MVNQVVEEHLPVGLKPAAAEKLLPLKEQPPVLVPHLIRCTSQGSADFGGILIQNFDKLSRRFKWERFITPFGEVQFSSRTVLVFLISESNSGNSSSLIVGMASPMSCHYPTKLKTELGGNAYSDRKNYGA
jgi:hypothetical protein